MELKFLEETPSFMEVRAARRSFPGIIRSVFCVNGERIRGKWKGYPGIMESVSGGEMGRVSRDNGERIRGKWEGYPGIIEKVSGGKWGVYSGIMESVSGIKGSVYWDN